MLYTIFNGNVCDNDSRSIKMKNLKLWQSTHCQCEWSMIERPFQIIEWLLIPSLYSKRFINRVIEIDSFLCLSTTKLYGVQLERDCSCYSIWWMAIKQMWQESIMGNNRSSLVLHESHFLYTNIHPCIFILPDSTLYQLTLMNTLLPLYYISFSLLKCSCFSHLSDTSFGSFSVHCQAVYYTFVNCFCFLVVTQE